ncbi:phosphoserine phosphatase SerB [Sanguibacter suarezii]|uniref:phosphoserine phosphatase SerB n=1 Tax=Sanguibacter suarezii TaxID=60921 RepID=UPI003F6F45F1
MTLPTQPSPPPPPPATSPVTGPRRLVVMDVDSTLISQEVIELIAAHAGTQERVAEITERAMRGELDFADSLRERVATLAGLPVSVLDDVRARATFTPGARELVAECQRRGWAVALVSGGFEEIVADLAAEVGITTFRANRLEVSDGHLTGRTTGQVVDRAYKEQSLREFAAAEGVPMEHTVAIGDGANDLDMICAAGIGIAFAAKPVVQEQAPFTVAGPRLDAVLEIIDAQG